METCVAFFGWQSQAALPLKIRLLHRLQSTDVVDVQHMGAKDFCLDCVKRRRMSFGKLSI